MTVTSQSISATRREGRQLNEVRIPIISKSLVCNTAGSSFIEIGQGVKVACSVRGPLQLTSEYRGGKGKVICGVSIAPFAQSGGRRDPNIGRHAVSPVEELAFVFEGICEQIVVLEKYPQLCFELNCVILQSESNKGSSSGNAGAAASGVIRSGDMVALTAGICSAFVNAGIEIHDLFAATTVIAVEQNPKDSKSLTFIVDPLPCEIASAVSMTTVISGTRTGKVMYLLQEGTVPVAAMGEMLELCVEGCKAQRTALTEQL
eukprot:Tbor_TRINITY_DN6021_c3_g3::TRINITY_DN6021_c3_g3_i1::g.11146::m.11146/K12587/MTR3, EXOSC6; exosome complex component MTR3